MRGRPTTCRAGNGRAWPSKRRVHRRSQEAPSRTYAPLKREALEPDGQKEPDEQKACHCVSARLAHLATNRPDIAFAGKECSCAEVKATRADLTDWLRAPRAVWEFPRQDEESTVAIGGHSDTKPLDVSKHDDQHLEAACAVSDRPWRRGLRHRRWCG